MGIDLALYRVRIGKMNCSGYRLYCSPYNNHLYLISIMLKYGLCMWLIFLLIVSGDIETNPGPPDLIKGLLLNTRSVKSVTLTHNKLADLQSLVFLKEAKLVCLTETWLTPDIDSSEILPVDQFAIYRQDRGSVGGGVLAAVHYSLPSRLRPELAPPSTINIEILVVEIAVPKRPKLALVTVYNPPRQTNAAGAQDLKNTLKSIREAGFVDICVLGDFNLPNLDLATDVPVSQAHSSELFYDIFLEFDLTHMVNCPTHNLGNRLDLILTTAPEKVSNIYTEEETFVSDRFLINFSVTSPCVNQKTPRFVLNYKKPTGMVSKQPCEQQTYLTSCRAPWEMCP